MNILNAYVVLFFLPSLSDEAAVRGGFASTLILTATITTDTLDPIAGIFTSIYITTILSLTFTGPTGTQSLPGTSTLATSTPTTSTTIISTTFDHLPSSTTTISNISISIVSSSKTTSSLTSSATTTVSISAGAVPGDSDRSIPIAAVIGVSSGLGLAIVLAGVAFWINRRQRKPRSKTTPLIVRTTRNSSFSAMSQESVAQSMWDGPHGSSETYWTGSIETDTQATQVVERKALFRDRLDNSRNMPYSTTNVSDEEYWKSSQQVRSDPRPRPSRSIPRLEQETPSSSESENLRQQTDLAVRDLETELDKFNRSIITRDYGTQEDTAIPQRRVSPEDMAIQKFNELHAAYQLHPLASRDKSLPDLPNDESDTVPRTISSHTVHSNGISSTQTKSAAELRTARYRTQALQALEGMTYASSSNYSQGSLSEAAESVDGVTNSKSLPNIWRIAQRQ